MKSIDAAKIIYTAYCREVGGKAFNGDTLPTWEEFNADPARAKQAHAWERAANELLNAFQLEGLPDEIKSMEVLEQASNLCTQIEAMPASEKQTALSVAAADLCRKISILIS